MTGLPGYLAVKLHVLRARYCVVVVVVTAVPLVSPKEQQRAENDPLLLGIVDRCTPRDPRRNVGQARLFREQASCSRDILLNYPGWRSTMPRNDRLGMVELSFGAKNRGSNLAKRSAFNCFENY